MMKTLNLKNIKYRYYIKPFLEFMDGMYTTTKPRDKSHRYIVFNKKIGGRADDKKRIMILDSGYLLISKPYYDEFWYRFDEDHCDFKFYLIRNFKENMNITIKNVITTNMKAKLIVD